MARNVLTIFVSRARRKSEHHPEDERRYTNVGCADKKPNESKQTAENIPRYCCPVAERPAGQDEHDRTEGAGKSVGGSSLWQGSCFRQMAQGKIVQMIERMNGRSGAPQGDWR